MYVRRRCGHRLGCAHDRDLLHILLVLVSVVIVWFSVYVVYRLFKSE